MLWNHVTRRGFMKKTALGAAAGTAAAVTSKFYPAFGYAKPSDKLALKGGDKACRFLAIDWPGDFVQDEDAQAVIEVLKSGNWTRFNNKNVVRFEEAYGKMVGANYCIATSSGTTALESALIGVGVEPGDEVLTCPFTFIATVTSILRVGALPVFVDAHPVSFNMDPDKIEAAITNRTKAIMPVHIYGNPAHMGRVMEIARKYNLKVVEDACQAWVAEWDGKVVATIGDAGGYSFQNSKNLPSGEGGAVVCKEQDTWTHMYRFQNWGRDYRGVTSDHAYNINGTNWKMTEFQAVILLAHLERLEAQSQTREQNAGYLIKQLKQIPGIIPQEMHKGATRNAYHALGFRYQKEYFQNISKARMLEAFRAEGAPIGSGYTVSLLHEPYLDDAMQSKVFTSHFSAKELDEYKDRMHCPVHDELLEDAFTIMQNALLGPRIHMDQIAHAVRKVQMNAGELV